MKRLLGAGLAMIVIIKMVKIIPISEEPLDLRKSIEASLITQPPAASTFIAIKPETQTLLNLLEIVIEQDRDYVKGKSMMESIPLSASNQKILELYKAKILSRTLNFDKALQLLATLDDRNLSILKSAVLIALPDLEKAKAYLHDLANSNIDDDIKLKAQALLNVYQTFDKHRDADESYLWTLFSQQLGDMKEFEISRYLAEKAIKRNSDYRDAWIIKGYDELVLKQFADAEISLLTAFQVDPGNPNIQYLLGLVYFELDKPDLSNKYLLYAKNSDVKYQSTILEKLAENAVKTKDFALAAFYYESLLKEKDEHAFAFQQLIWLNSEPLNQLEKALEYAKKYSEEFPQDKKSKELLAWILGKMGKYEEGNKVIQEP